MGKPNRKKRCNIDKLRFTILTELPRYKSFKNLPNMEKDDIITFILAAIDKAVEGVGDLHD